MVPSIIPTGQINPEMPKVSEKKLRNLIPSRFLFCFPARLLQTLSALQSQLHELEEENSISRRRVRELELELEDCKRDVVRERTRLIEREDFKKGDVSGLRVAGSSSRAKGKNKARDVSGFGRPELDDEKLRARYKEAVDEKKGLCSFLGIFSKLRMLFFN